MLIALALLTMLAAAAMFSAAALRLGKLVSTLIAAYVLLVGEVTALTLVLSPFHAVTRTGLATAAEVLLACALVIWWLRGKPGIGLRQGLRTVRHIVRDPVVAAFLALVGAALAYELLLVWTVPANNWDSLTYHLPRVAAWAQHRGVYWIPNAPTDRMNEFQPIAEQQILFLFVAAKKAVLFALPQFIAQLAIMISIYGSARRLEFGARPAACAALLFATLSLVVLEATTSQNDIVAASLPAAAMALLLEGGTTTAILAGVAVALGLGVKLTTALVLPVLVVLALRSGRRHALLAGLGAVAAFVGLAMWGFVLNVMHTSHVLGHGGGRVEQTVSPSFPGSLATLTRISYRLLDLTGFRPGLLRVVTFAAVLVLVGVVLVLLRNRGSREIDGTFLLSVVLLAPALVLVAATAIKHSFNAFSTGVLKAPNRRVSEDFSAFGPLGGLVLVTAVALTAVAAARRRADTRRLALAAALPLFIVILALTSKDNPWLSRFLIVPVALTVPLAALLFSRRSATLGIVAVAAVSLAVTLERNELKPFKSSFGRPWHLRSYEAAELTWKPAIGAAQHELDRVLPARACVGAAVGSDDPSYLIYGPSLGRRVVYLPRDDAPEAALRAGLRYVVIDTDGPLASTFSATGWSLHPLNSPDRPFWTLAVRIGGAKGGCESNGGRF